MSTAAQPLEPRPEPRAVEPPSPAETPNAADLLDTMPWLPCTLTLEVPVVRFTIGDLLALKKSSIVETACHHTSDVPLRVNQLLIGWTEFDVIGDRLAVRITEQA
ncbi:MAG TPA: FliM/FliN family flagellar motor C-terminal domain-containing protein [Terracidiphilus sp.]|jgi:flagellar motor switch/type III secretory pathway protein FliN|nr:FliM/FliN family flagellar motor C-terminal domain-containing protein [Terracidiphilus sp.]